jgi:hypothetical protein
MKHIDIDIVIDIVLLELEKHSKHTPPKNAG